jgi:hypothetical protein
MKKLLSIITIIVIICTSFSVISEEEPQGIDISDAIRSFMLSSYPEKAEKIIRISNENIRNKVEHETQWPGSTVYGATQEKIEETIQRRINNGGVIPENSFCIYPLITMRYSKQYANSYNFDELISDNKIWICPNKTFDVSTKYYDKDFLETPYRSSFNMCDKETIEYLQNPDAIEEQVRNEIDEDILDCKIILNGETIIMYIKGTLADYGIKLYSFPRTQNEGMCLDNFKVYTMAELLQSMANYITLPSIESLDQKPTFETEAQALQEDDLLQGNDRGLDLLKPLTRIEATTLLVRALGYENEPTETESKFADIPNGNWGVRYANIAADKGITQGIGDNKFAPDDLVTDNQFATLVLRSANEPEFDWKNAINLLIEKGIITEEQSQTMDLFTRGDMAKIIYEARQKDLIN